MKFIDTSGQTNWKFITIVVIVALVVGGGILYYRHTILEMPEDGLPQLTLTQEEDETAHWKVYRYANWGFSMKIHPDYTKEQDKEIDAEGIRVQSTIFSSINEKVAISIDQSDGVEMLRATLFDAIKEVETSPEKSIENLQHLGFLESDAVASLEKFEKDNCTGIQFIEEKGIKSERNIELTSPNLEDMYLSISFDYLQENEPEVLKMIGTIECVTPEVKSGEVDTSNWQTYRNEEFGFEVKYPAMYEVGYNPKYPETISFGERNEYGVREPNIFITIMEKPTVLGFQGTWGVMLRTGLNQHVVYSENVEVDGQSFEKEKWSQGPTGITAYIVRDQLTYTLLVGFTNEESVQKETLLFDQILSTFRFIE